MQYNTESNEVLHEVVNGHIARHLQHHITILANHYTMPLFTVQTAQMHKVSLHGHLMAIHVHVDSLSATKNTLNVGCLAYPV